MTTNNNKDLLLLGHDPGLFKGPETSLWLRKEESSVTLTFEAEFPSQFRETERFSITVTDEGKVRIEGLSPEDVEWG